MDLSILEGTDLVLFFLIVSVESREIDVRGGIVDPRLGSVGSEAFVNDDGGEGD